MSVREQQTSALAHGDQCRRVRAATRRAMAEMTMADSAAWLTDLMRDPPDWMRAVEVAEALLWPYGIRHSKAARIWKRAQGPDHWSPYKTVGALTPRQCDSLARELVAVVQGLYYQRRRQ